MMNCSGCKTGWLHFDSQHSWWECNTCGLIEGIEFDSSEFSFKDRVLEKDNSNLGSVKISADWRRGIVESKVVLAEFYPTPNIVKQVEQNYLSLVKKHMFRGFNMDERAGGLVYFTLRDNGRSVSLKEVARKSGTSTKRISKLARKIAAHYKRSYVFSSLNPVNEFERHVQRLDLPKNFERDCVNVFLSIRELCERDNIQTTSTFIGTVLWIVNKLRDETLTQSAISKQVGCSTRKMRNMKERILNLVGMKKEQFEDLSVDDFVNGMW
tara:strand:- start:17750 stop:18553 length:804 start_codon:yes stop_codon:yes gene_type:complete